MKITVISDTHGTLKDSLKEILPASDHVIHAGDIGSLRVFKELKALNANTYFVKGNCDRASWALNLPETLQFHIDGLLFYVIHNRASLAFRPENADIMICGHTHRYAKTRYNGSILLNPGSCTQPRDGTASYALITTHNGELVSIERLKL